MNDIRLNDYGTKFLVAVKDQDNEIYSITDKDIEFWFAKPDKTILSRVPTLVETGVYGECYYITQSGEIDALGLWRLQLKISDVGEQFFSDIYNFRVTKVVDSE